MPDAMPWTPARAEPVSALWRPAIEERRRACRDVPGGYVLLAVPDRQAVCGADPERSAPGLDDLVVDLAPGLRARRKVAETYVASGLTDYGAYAASRDLFEALRERIDVSPVPEASLSFWDEAAGGGAPCEAEPRIRLPGQDAWRRVFGASVFGGGAVQAFESRDRSLPAALAFAALGGASATLTRMLPFLCPSFSRLVAVTSPDLFLDLMESEQPAAVFKLLTRRELAEPPARMRRDFEPWSGLRLPLPTGRGGAVVRLRAGCGAERLLREGWSACEPEHTWAIGPASTLVAPEPLADCALELVMELSPCVFPPRAPSQLLDVEANGTQVGSFRLSEPARLSVEIPAHVRQSARTLTLRFVHPDFVTPAQVGWNDDDRPLALCFGRIELRPKDA